MITPLHASLGNKARPCLEKKKRKRKGKKKRKREKLREIFEIPLTTDRFLKSEMRTSLLDEKSRNQVASELIICIHKHLSHHFFICKMKDLMLVIYEDVLKNPFQWK